MVRFSNYKHCTEDRLNDALHWPVRELIFCFKNFLLVLSSNLRNTQVSLGPTPGQGQSLASGGPVSGKW